MVGELHWSWGAAGSGFTLLGVFCGITATVPAMLIRRFGVRATLSPGGLVMAAAFACLADAHGPGALFARLSRWRDWASRCWPPCRAPIFWPGCSRSPDFAFGLYFTIGGLGGVAGPLLYLLIQSSAAGLARFLDGLGCVIVTLAALLAALFWWMRKPMSRAAAKPSAITRESWTRQGGAEDAAIRRPGRRL